MLSESLFFFMFVGVQIRVVAKTMPKVRVCVHRYRRSEISQLALIISQRTRKSSPPFPASSPKIPANWTSHRDLLHALISLIESVPKSLFFTDRQRTRQTSLHQTPARSDSRNTQHRSPREGGTCSHTGIQVLWDQIRKGIRGVFRDGRRVE